MPMYMVNLRSLVPQNLERMFRFRQEIRQEVGRLLQAFFHPIVVNRARPGQPPFTGAAITWGPVAAKIADDEMVCYFVTDRARSVISSVGGGINTGIHGPVGTGGNTFASSSGMVSEVYLDRVVGGPIAIANVAFHELMHNKLDAQQDGAPVASIHNTDGMAVPDGIVRDFPSPANIALMRDNIFRVVPQYRGRL
jgi:hypothetical protein